MIFFTTAFLACKEKEKSCLFLSFFLLKKKNLKLFVKSLKRPDFVRALLKTWHVVLKGLNPKTLFVICLGFC
jgi:hypothetical protein